MDPSDHLVTTATLRRTLSTREIAHAVRRGELVRLRRGTYCAGELWQAIDGRERHILHAAAVVADTREPVLAVLSAAALWDIPIVGEWPDDVTLVAPYRGGGKSEPGVRRTALAARGLRAERRRGLPVTSLSRTVVDLVAHVGLEAGVVAADWALAHGTTREELLAAASSRSSRNAAERIARAIEFADPRAGSPGESAARLAIHAAGFVTPELQVQFRDHAGVMRVDFLWRQARIVGEFDGKMKYTRDEFALGDPAQRVWEEKRREDRLRRIHPGHVRIAWAEVRDRTALIRVLSAAGVPRAG